jgi:hypothetical protein
VDTLNEAIVFAVYDTVFRVKPFLKAESMMASEGLFRSRDGAGRFFPPLLVPAKAS